MGCYSEWDDQRKECAFCGWQKDEKQSRSEGWQQGQVLEKRFLLGKILKKKKLFTIWYAYDEMLDCRCFLMTDMSEEFLHKVVEIPDERIRQMGYCCLGYRQIEEKNVFVFSKQEGAIQKKEKKESKKEKKKLILNVQGKGQNQLGLLPADTLLDGRFQVIGTLGIGGFGITYLCVDINLNRNVAIKEYFPKEWAEREENYVTVKNSKMLQAFQYGKQTFLQEIKMSAKFIHTENLITVYDAFEENDTVYMVMEYLEGQSLGKEMQQRKAPLEEKEIKKMAKDILGALQMLHSRKIVHSDISPGNIFHTGQGKYVLIDLGAAKYVYNQNISIATAFLKPDYAAPEQYQSASLGTGGQEGAWTDIYAMGAVFYQCFTGKKAPDVIQRLEGNSTRITFPRKWGFHFSSGWKKIIRQCMELEKEKRPSDAEVLWQKIDMLKNK